MTKPKTSVVKKIVDDDYDDNVIQDVPESNASSKARSVPRQPVHSKKQSRPKGEKIFSFPAAARAAEKSDEKACIEECMKGGHLESAEAALARLVAKGNADAVSYNMVISLCAKQGATERAHEWMLRMLGAGVCADSASFNSVIDACARCGDIKGAEQWLSKMLASGVAANTISHNAVINACARAGDIPRAQWWLTHLCEKGTPDVVSYTSVINACAKKGDVRGAEEWLRRMLET